MDILIDVLILHYDDHGYLLLHYIRNCVFTHMDLFC